MSENDWHKNAACVEVGPEIFFPREQESNNAWPTAAAARAVCEDCPVRKLCLDDTMQREHGAPESQRTGIWGGLGPKQRYRLERKGEFKAPLEERAYKHGAETVQKIRTLYGNGLTLQQIAQQTGLTYGQTRDLIRRHGISNRRTTTADAALAGRDALVLQMLADGVNRALIAERLDITVAQVDAAKRRRNIAADRDQAVAS